VPSLIPTPELIVGLAVLLAVVHFTVPMVYYHYAKTQWYREPWTITIDGSYQPHISLIIPTYNENEFIEGKLTNIAEDDFPPNLLEVIVVDSASTDNTALLAETWAREHPGLFVRVIKETARKGKLTALLRAFEAVSSLSELAIVTDVDVRFQKGTIRKAAKYFADSNVGIVTASLAYSSEVPAESTYRGYYNVVRVAESKKHSTPIQSGVFQAIRTRALRKIGVPVFPGSDDGAFASYMAFGGYRSIQVEDISVKEPMRGSQFSTKLRRAQHVILNFLLTKKYAKTKNVYRKTGFDIIWAIEFWLIVINPWILMAAVLMVALSFLLGSGQLASIPLLASLVLLLFKPYRAWVSQQLYLVLGFLRNLITPKEVWVK
jgi:biofilm PGA synthesis N-glycosyltransferase PgaC